MNRSVMWDVGEMAADPLFGRIQICLCMLPVNCPSQALESRISQFSWSWSHWGLVKKMQCTISVSACCCFRQNQATVPNLFPQRWVRNMGFCSRFLVVWAKYSCRQPCYKVLYGTTGWSWMKYEPFLERGLEEMARFSSGCPSHQATKLISLFPSSPWVFK